MILVDTSVWVDHFRAADPGLIELLNTTQVLMHPHVIGEIALGNLAQRDLVLDLLANLPSSIVATDAEVLNFITDSRLFGLGIGYVDAHLLASARLAAAPLWTRDRRLLAAAQATDVATHRA